MNRPEWALVDVTDVRGSVESNRLDVTVVSSKCRNGPRLRDHEDSKAGTLRAEQDVRHQVGCGAPRPAKDRAVWGRCRRCTSRSTTRWTWRPMRPSWPSSALRSWTSTSGRAHGWAEYEGDRGAVDVRLDDPETVHRVIIEKGCQRGPLFQELSAASPTSHPRRVGDVMRERASEDGSDAVVGHRYAGLVGSPRGA